MYEIYFYPLAAGIGQLNARLAVRAVNKLNHAHFFPFLPFFRLENKHLSAIRATNF